MKENNSSYNPAQQEITQPVESLSQEELENLIAAVGNHEAKAITLLAMREGNPFTKSRLHSSVMTAQGQQLGWEISRGTVFDYCKDTFAPLGIATEHTLNENGSASEYRLSEYGLQYAVPLAGLLLEFSDKYPDVSLNQLFGGTKSNSPKIQTYAGGPDGGAPHKKRSVSVRLGILRELAMSEVPIRKLDIMERTGFDNDTIRMHFAEMRKAGIFTYDVAEHSQSFAFYKYQENEDDLVPYPHSMSLTERVYSVIKQQPDSFLSGEACLVSLLEQYPDMASLNQRALQERIVKVLSHLEKTGFAVRQKFAKDSRSEITLSARQREIVTDIVGLLDDFQQGSHEVMERGYCLAERIAECPEKVSTLMAKAKNISRYANAQSLVDSEQTLLSILRRHPGITTGEVEAIVHAERQSGHREVYNMLTQLEHTGQVQSVKRANTKEWTIFDAHNGSEK